MLKAQYCPSVTLGIGECALFRGLSAEDCPDYEAQLASACLSPQKALDSSYSSIRFGFETALSTLSPSAWLLGKSGIPTNGLVWMGDKATMAERIDTKIEQGFRVLKLNFSTAYADAILRRHLKYGLTQMAAFPLRMRKNVLAALRNSAFIPSSSR